LLVITAHRHSPLTTQRITTEPPMREFFSSLLEQNPITLARIRRR
jgi:hypothetical protein